MSYFKIIDKILASREKTVTIILFFLVVKISLAGYAVMKSGKSAESTFLTQAVAQEETIDVKDTSTDEVVGGGEDLEAIPLLEQKRIELEKKEEALKEEEKRLQELKADIEARMEKLAQAEKKIDQLITLKDSEQDRELTKLAKVFEATPPEQAGPMFNKLDVDLAAKILVRIKGRSAGKIWGYVNPEQAVKISQELTKLK